MVDDDTDDPLYLWIGMLQKVNICVITWWVRQNVVYSCNRKLVNCKKKQTTYTCHDMHKLDKHCAKGKKKSKMQRPHNVWYHLDEYPERANLGR